MSAVISTVDREARRRGAEVLRDLADARITNFEFDERFPNSSDPALRAIRRNVWHLYSDLHEHTLDGLPASARDELNRAVQFLETENEYRWPAWIDHPAMVLSVPLSIISFGAVGRLLRRIYERNGEFSAWPFLNQKEAIEAESSRRGR